MVEIAPRCMTVNYVANFVNIAIIYSCGSQAAMVYGEATVQLYQ